MAKVTFSKPHLLLLDEPSNHLDMDAVEALVEVSDGGGLSGVSCSLTAPGTSRTQQTRRCTKLPHKLHHYIDLESCSWTTAQGLALFQGGVLMVSHDQHLIESTVDELWAVEGGRGESVAELLAADPVPGRWRTMAREGCPDCALQASLCELLLLRSTALPIPTAVTVFHGTFEDYKKRLRMLHR